MNPPQRFKSLKRIVFNVSTLFGSAHFEKSHEVTLSEDNDNVDHVASGVSAPDLLPQAEKPSKLLSFMWKVMDD
jgi:hypothetical protein